MYAIYVLNGKLEEKRIGHPLPHAHTGNCRCPKWTVPNAGDVLLRYDDRSDLKVATLCNVAVEAARLQVPVEEIEHALARWMITDDDLVRWVESLGGSLTLVRRNDDVHLVEPGRGINPGDYWLCTFGEIKCEAHYPYDAVAGCRHVMQRSRSAVPA